MEVNWTPVLVVLVGGAVVGGVVIALKGKGSSAATSGPSGLPRPIPDSFTNPPSANVGPSQSAPTSSDPAPQVSTPEQQQQVVADMVKACQDAKLRFRNAETLLSSVQIRYANGQATRDELGAAATEYGAAQVGLGACA